MMIQQQGRILGLPLMNLVRLNKTPILRQLHLEEKLLRTSTDGASLMKVQIRLPLLWGSLGKYVKAILHRKPSELLEIGSVLRDQVPVIRRFTGGGMVIVDKETVFVTLICNKDDVPGVQPYPRSIMSWSGLLYDRVFKGIGDFQLRENDYVFGYRKFGGNAQSITKNRWIHHTSFLWDYAVGNTAYLKQPARAPKYRMAKDHTQFICKMKEYLPRSVFIAKTIEAIETYFSVKHVNLEAAEGPRGAEFVHSTRLLTKQELEEALGPQQEIIGVSV